MTDRLRAQVRPKHLNLFKIALPIPGVLSILHRISGIFLTLAFPVILWFLDMSLESPEGYDRASDILGHPFAKIVVLGGAWAFFHHLCAGVRYLLLDIHIGVDLLSARRSAKISFAISFTLTLLLGWWLWV